MHKNREKNIEKMQMSDTIIIRGDVIMITRKAEKYINNWRTK